MLKFGIAKTLRTTRNVCMKFNMNSPGQVFIKNIQKKTGCFDKYCKQSPKYSFRLLVLKNMQQSAEWQDKFNWLAYRLKKLIANKTIITPFLPSAPCFSSGLWTRLKVKILTTLSSSHSAETLVNVTLGQGTMHTIRAWKGGWNRQNVLHHLSCGVWHQIVGDWSFESCVLPSGVSQHCDEIINVLHFTCSWSVYICHGLWMSLLSKSYEAKVL